MDVTGTYIALVSCYTSQIFTSLVITVFVQSSWYKKFPEISEQKIGSKSVIIDV